jgi:hypothetical protein
MQMHQIRYFLALCEERNFTRAAKRCGVSQPSLTNAIIALEQELGGALFQRKPLVSLTVLGDAVHLISTGSPKTPTMRARPRRRWPTCGGQRLCHCSRLVSVDYDAVDVDGRVRHVIAAAVNEVGCSSCGVEESANHTPGDLLSAAAAAARCRDCRRGSFILNLPSNHLITSSARTSSGSAMVTPSVISR